MLWREVGRLEDLKRDENGDVEIFQEEQRVLKVVYSKRKNGVEVYFKYVRGGGLLLTTKGVLGEFGDLRDARKGFSDFIKQRFWDGNWGGKNMKSEEKKDMDFVRKGIESFDNPQTCLFA
jgi:hypothetical protein